MNNNQYIKNLECIVKQMLNPLKGIPFKLVIEGISGYMIIPFNKKDKRDITVLKKLVQVAILSGTEVNKNGIKRNRPNEVGNDIEIFVKNALNQIKYKADTPLTKNGKKKSTGYPDLQFTDEYKRIHYLECKTYNIENVETTQRSFYLSPSDEFKITKNAHHFLISFEIYIDGSDGKNNIYKCKSWKILTLDDLKTDVKYEFNSDNARLYSKELILAEGKL